MLFITGYSFFKCNFSPLRIPPCPAVCIVWMLVWWWAALKRNTRLSLKKRREKKTKQSLVSEKDVQCTKDANPLTSPTSSTAGNGQSTCCPGTGWKAPRWGTYEGLCMKEWVVNLLGRLHERRQGRGERYTNSLSAVPEDVLAGVQLQTARAVRFVLDHDGDAHFGLRRQRKSQDLKSRCVFKQACSESRAVIWRFWAFQGD